MLATVREHDNKRMPGKHAESVSHKELWHHYFNRAYDALVGTLEKDSKFYEQDKADIERGLRGKSVTQLKETYGRVSHRPSEHDLDMATSGNMVAGDLRKHPASTRTK
jgi:hypothetical protein